MEEIAINNLRWAVHEACRASRASRATSVDPVRAILGTDNIQAYDIGVLVMQVCAGKTKGCIEVLEVLLEKGLSICDGSYEKLFPRGDPINFVNMVEMIPILIKAGANIRKYPLVYSYFKLRRFDLVIAFLKHGADPNMRKMIPRNHVTETDELSCTPFHQACSHGHVDVIRALLEAGVIIEQFLIINDFGPPENDKKIRQLIRDNLSKGFKEVVARGLVKGSASPFEFFIEEGHQLLGYISDLMLPPALQSSVSIP